MDPQVIKTLVAGLVLFGIFGVVPIVMALLSHQQKMAQLFAKSNLENLEMIARLEAMERKLSALEPRQSASGKSIESDH
jgi:hypothetical protein